MGNYLASGTTVEKPLHVKPTRKLTNEKGRRKVRPEDLPEDLLCTILAKLPAKEAVRTSVLSSEWRWVWATCPKLSFNCGSVSGCGEKQHTQMFIDGVNAVLQKYRGKVVDELDIRFKFESKLVDHLNNWIRFAMSSWTKNLAIDLAPSFTFEQLSYKFPFELLDIESASCLQCLQLSFVCVKPPPNFIGFPILRKLDLHFLNTTRQDLEDLLGNCSNLEWLSIVRCDLNDELKVVRPLPRLQYLQLMHCEITKIEFLAAKLLTFVYNGSCIPIALRHASTLENAKIWFQETVFQHAVAAILSGLPDVRNLTLQFSILQLGTQWMLDSPHKFSQLRHVQIMLLVHDEDTDKIINIVSFLRASPFIEKLEVHFNGIYTMWFANKGSPRHGIPTCEYKYLKNLHVTGFRAARGQREFLEHVVENAPAIAAVTVDTTQRLTDVVCPDEVDSELCSAALDKVRGPLLMRLPPHAKLLLLLEGQMHVQPLFRFKCRKIEARCF